jgi:hypothetical protein
VALAAGATRDSGGLGREIGAFAVACNAAVRQKVDHLFA